MHGLLEILDQIRQSTSSQRQGLDFLAGIYPVIKAIQAAVTLGTGCSLGPEGPSVDIGKSCANGFALMMENNRERRIALTAAGAASGIASGIIYTIPLFNSLCTFYIDIYVLLDCQCTEQQHSSFALVLCCLTLALTW